MDKLCSFFNWILLLWHKLMSMQLCKKSEGYLGDATNKVLELAHPYEKFGIDSLLKDVTYEHDKYEAEFKKMGNDIWLGTYKDKRKYIEGSQCDHILRFMMKYGYIQQVQLKDNENPKSFEREYFYTLSDEGRIAKAIKSHSKYIKLSTSFNEAKLKHPSFLYRTRYITFSTSIFALCISIYTGCYKNNKELKDLHSTANTADTNYKRLFQEVEQLKTIPHYPTATDTNLNQKSDHSTSK